MGPAGHHPISGRFVAAAQFDDVKTAVHVQRFTRNPARGALLRLLNQ